MYTINDLIELLSSYSSQLELNGRSWYTWNTSGTHKEVLYYLRYNEDLLEINDPFPFEVTQEDIDNAFNAL